jgi:hypothetical protein
MGMGVLLPCDNIRRSGDEYSGIKKYSVTTFDRIPVNTTFGMDQWFDKLRAIAGVNLLLASSVSCTCHGPELAKLLYTQITHSISYKLIYM